MAKFLFIQDILFEYFAPGYLSAMLKEHGHECEMHIFSQDGKLSDRLKRLKPDAILISSMTGPHVGYLNLLKEIKKEFNLPVLMGGAHPTFFPKVLEYDHIDYICVGEGESAIVDFANALQNKDDITKIPNIGFKDANGIHLNELRPLQTNLDVLSFPDRHLYYSRYPALAAYPTKRFLTSRGCPYNCTFCFNHASKAMYRGKGKYVRHRSAENIIEEIMQVSRKYLLKTVRFPDDSFTLDKPWLLDFLTKYRDHVKLPFTCLARANELDESVVAAFKDAGCCNLFFGVETGNENVRNTVLKKSLTDEKIINASMLLNKYKLSYGTYNMIGLPGETIEDAFKTIQFNSKIKSRMPSCTIFQPYPGTDLAKYAIEQGYMEDEPDVDSFAGMLSKSLLKHQNVSQLINLNALFFLGVRFPVLIPVIRVLIALPPNRIFRLIGFFSLGIVRLKSQNVGFVEGLKVALRFRKKL